MAALTASFFSGVRPLPLAVLILSFLASHIQAQDQDSPTTVPIFLPAYSKTELWSSLRGSVITSTDDETLYTIFCAPSATTTTTGWIEQSDFPACNIADGDGRFPFTFWEGPSTLHVNRVGDDSYSLTEGCSLYGTTAATCSATASVAATTYLDGLTVVSTDSFVTTIAPTAAIAVVWGVLTLAEPPVRTTITKNDITLVSTYYPDTSNTDTAAPTETTVATITSTASVAGTGSASGSDAVSSTSAGSSSGGSETTGAVASAETTPSSAAKLGGLEASLLLLVGVVSVLLW
ncbi:hypothetical protein F4821DRAFT_246199 [Hypoxylon rubiginosum]|uniref:Uncharacterized protein n=1 Tax=Hypoxylon rubiginosum TaxID=110542 RepID=A0ACC0CQY2_9PEZI|nr:hypothetical protein F4821DRAFT_246199 [Hypoxylon rubiginosum]